MDITFEVTTGTLVELLNERLSRERLILPILLSDRDDALVFHHGRLAGLQWLPSIDAMETIRVAGLYVAGERPVRWLNVPQLSAQAIVRIHFAQLSVLRHLAPDGIASTRFFDIPVVIQIRLRPVGRQVRLTVGLTDIDLRPIRPILIAQLIADRTLDPAEERAIEREADDRIASLRRQAFNQLGMTSAGSLSIAFDLSILRMMFGSAEPAPYNAGIALLQPVPGMSGESVLVIAIQFENSSWFIRDPLEAARASAVIWNWWNQFYRTRRPSIVAGHSWTLDVRGEVIADALRAQLSNSISDSRDGEVQRRGPVSAQWRAPISPEFPNGSISASLAINLRRFDIDANVRVFSQLLRRNDHEILVASRFEWDLNEAQVAAWASLSGVVGSGIGTVIGGAASAGIGAAVGFVVGFVVGFIAGEIGAHVYTPTLPAPPNCTQRERELICRFPFPADIGELISGLRVLNISGIETGVLISGTAAPMMMRPARPAVVLWRSFRWQRTGPLGTRSWSAVLEFDLYNRGDKPLLAGPVVAYGDEASLYTNRIMIPNGPIRGGAMIRLRLVVPRAQLEAERAAGRLRPPQLIIFTNAGARVLETSELPEPITDEQIDTVDSIEATAAEVRQMERASRVLFHVFPDPPEPRLAVPVHTLLQAAARNGDPTTQLLLVDSKSRTILTSSRFGDNGEAGLTALVPGIPEHIGLMVLPAELTASQLAEAVAIGLLNAGDSTIVHDAFAAALGNAIVSPELQPDQSGPIVSIEGWFDLWINRVQAGSIESALKSIRANGYRDSGMDIIALRTLLFEGASIYLPNPAKLEPVVHIPSGRQMLSVSTELGVLRFDVDGLAHPMLAATEANFEEARPLTFNSALDGLVPIGHSLVARGDMLNDGASLQLANRLVVLTVADQRRAASMFEGNQ